MSHYLDFLNIIIKKTKLILHVKELITPCNRTLLDIVQYFAATNNTEKSR